MEQKQTLWIIAAAGMFLLVVLGFGYFIYSGDRNRAPATVAQNYQVQTPAPQSGNYSGFMPSTGTNGNQLLPPPVPGEIRTNDLTVYTDKAVVYGSETSEGTTFDLNALKAVTEMAPAQETYPQNINITVNLPETKYEAAPTNVVSVTEVPVHIVQADAGVKAPVAQAPVTEIKPAEVKSPVTVKKAPETKAVAKTEPKVTVTTNTKTGTTVKTAEIKAPEKKVEQFWVQASSYSNKKTAESARSVLDDNKIPADIFTYQDAKGAVFYRVRVGPYTTKSEAEYWRTKIEKIAAFSKANSYITSN